MMKQELQELVTELQDICNSLLAMESQSVLDPVSAQNNEIDALIRLTICIHRLKRYPLYIKKADEILDAVELYQQTYSYTHQDASKKCYIVHMDIVSKTEELISELNQLLEIDLLASLKKGYAEAKDTVADAIPDEVKDTYKVAVTTLHDVGRKAEKRLKSKLKNWLLSDDNGEE